MNTIIAATISSLDMICKQKVHKPFSILKENYYCTLINLLSGCGLKCIMRLFWPQGAKVHEGLFSLSYFVSLRPHIIHLKPQPAIAY